MKDETTDSKNKSSSMAKMGDRMEWWKGALLVGVLLYPGVLYLVIPENTFWVGVLVKLFLFAGAAISFDFLFGYTGLLSFGHAMFFGGGLYVAAIASTQFGLTYYQAVPIAIAVLLFLSLLAGAVSLRTTGVYFAILTLAIAQLQYEVILQFSEYTGGRNGISLELPLFFGVNLRNPYIAYYICFGLLLGTYLGLRRVVRSPFGRILQGIRENEERMRMLGINTYWYKLGSFVIAGMVGGLVGLFYPLFLNFVDSTLVYWLTTGDIVIITIIGGIGTLWGPIAGAVFYIMLETGLTGIIDRWRFILGTVFVIFVLAFPSGIAGLVEGESKSLITHVRQWRTEDDGALSDLFQRIRGGER